MDAGCYICKRPKANHTCEACERQICKACSNKLRPGTFALMANVPKELTHNLYCGFCYDAKVVPVLSSYEADRARAKAVCVFFKGQGEESRFYSRSEKPLKIVGTSDREETLLQLAFKAVQGGFNGIVDTELTSEKVRNEGFQTTRWRAHGIPTHIDVEKLERLETPGKIMLPAAPHSR